MQSAQSAFLDGAKILLLDDGMQHRKIFKDFEIVLLDAEHPFGNGLFFLLEFAR